MNWLTRLKNSDRLSEPDTTKPAKPGFVGFVAVIPEPFQKSGADAVASPELVAGWVSDPARDAPDPLDSNVLQRVEVKQSDPDRWCWPHSLTMNVAEIDTFAARLHQFTDKGLARNDGEALADKLVLRDRDQDERRVCLECKHFAGHGAGSWRCGNWQAAGVAIRSRDAQLPADLVVQLQRCDGFTAHPISIPQGAEDEHDRH